MLALYRAGQQADALAAYHDARRHLVDELGVEPTEQLRQLQERILAGDPALGPPARPDAATLTSQAGPAVSHPPALPAQLPYRAPDFIGRSAELDRLHALVTEDASAATIAVITGTAGVGKTSLAVQWAHEARDRFPDGQLYVNLLGFDPAYPPLPPGEAIRMLLDALGVPPQLVPVTPLAQTTLYRSLLAGRRMLVVLDNARDAEQVRPLLPGGPDCLVVVTSRDQLAGLVAAQGARPVTLDLLTTTEARHLLTKRLGAERAGAEPAAVDEIIARCAHLPLALSIVASRAALHPDFSLASLAAQLRAAGGLDAFHHDDAITDVRAVLSWSYDALGGPAARMLRLLSLHPGPDLGAAAAASIAGLPAREAAAALATLARVHLCHERAPGRFGLHDLLRVYAAERVDQDEPAGAQGAARTRLHDHYLHTAAAADRLLNPHRPSLGLDDPAPGTTRQPLNSTEDALAWFSAEHHALLAIVDQLATAQLDRRTWQLASALTTYLNRRGHWSDLVATQRAALAAAVRLDDRPAQAAAHRSLATAYLQLRRSPDAESQLRQALQAYLELGDATGQARAHLNLAYVTQQDSRFHDALDHAEQALALFRADGDEVGQADALNAVGWYEAHLGRPQQALSYCTQALALHQTTGDREGEAHTWHSLAFAHQQLGDDAQAIASYQRALVLWRQLGDRYFEADALTRVGDVRHRTGDVAAARPAWREALAILDAFGHADAEQVRARLSGPATPITNGGCHERPGHQPPRHRADRPEDGAAQQPAVR
jgi:tetratricopeptide (TPR) repeat protein